MPYRRWAIDGELCTIHLRLAGASDRQFDELVRGTLEPARPALEQRLRDSLLQSFGPSLAVDRLDLNPRAHDILIRIKANAYLIKNTANLEKALTKFVSYLQDVLNEYVRDKLERAAFQGQWFAAPPLIRTQSDPPERYVSFLQRAQQPLITLLLGTILGSALIPWIQSRSSLKRIRHQERIKLALEIIDQNRKTNSKLVGLRTAIWLFAKDHAEPQPAAKLAKQQEDMLLWYNAQYLSFNEQAWWWYWSVQMKAQLSTLATAEEATKIQGLAQDYDKKLKQCVADLDDPWQVLLRQRYDPQNWKKGTYQALLNKANSSLDQHNRERDGLALQMSEVFASEPNGWFPRLWKWCAELF